MQRTQRSFAKNGKEHKDCNVLLQRTKKKARTFRSFAKERENVPFFLGSLCLLSRVECGQIVCGLDRTGQLTKGQA